MLLTHTDRVWMDRLSLVISQNPSFLLAPNPQKYIQMLPWVCLIRKFPWGLGWWRTPRPTELLREEKPRRKQ